MFEPIQCYNDSNNQTLAFEQPHKLLENSLNWPKNIVITLKINLFNVRNNI